MDKSKVITKKHGKKKGDAESTDVSVMLWGSSLRIVGHKEAIDALTTSDLNRLRWQLMGGCGAGNHQDRTKAKAWLEKRKLTFGYATKA